MRTSTRKTVRERKIKMITETTMRSYRLRAEQKDVPDEIIIAESINSAVKKFSKFLEYRNCDNYDAETEEYECNLLFQRPQIIARTVSADESILEMLTSQQTQTYIVSSDYDSDENLKRVRKRDGSTVNITHKDLCRQLGFEKQAPAVKVTNRGTITYNSDDATVTMLWTLLTAVICQDYVPAKALLKILK